MTIRTLKRLVSQKRTLGPPESDAWRDTIRASEEFVTYQPSRRHTCVRSSSSSVLLIYYWTEGRHSDLLTGSMHLWWVDLTLMWAKSVLLMSILSKRVPLSGPIGN